MNLVNHDAIIIIKPCVIYFGFSEGGALQVDETKALSSSKIIRVIQSRKFPGVVAMLVLNLFNAHLTI